MHPNHRLLYEIILALAPQSVLEFGCGGGDHLHNLSVLLPGVEAYGLDRSESQLAFVRKRHPELGDNVACGNIAEILEGVEVADVVYTQAVIMHIQTDDAHLEALGNAFRLAARQVVLVENWTKHDFFGDILRLKTDGCIDWDEVNLYYRKVDEPGEEASAIIASRTVLSDLPVLDRYDRLLSPSPVPA